MLNEKDKKDIEKDIKKKTNKKEDEVEIKVTKKKKKFNNFKVKYKKDKKKYAVAVSAILIMLSLTIGSSYAYLTYVSKTNNTVTINAGTLALVFQNETNTINIQNAVPVKDSVGLSGEQEYSFDIKNNGSIPATYKITLDNTCQTSNQIDLCIPDEYIKAGLKVGNDDYKVVERNDKNEYVIDTGSLGKNASQTYKMKIWLDHETPNSYNSKGGKTVVYSGKLGLTYEQGKKPLVTLDANGGTIPAGSDWVGEGETATKTVDTGGTYGTLPTPTRDGYTFAGWIGKNMFDEETLLMAISGAKYEDGYYSFTSTNIYRKYGNGNSIPIYDFNDNTRYTISIYGYTLDSGWSRNFWINYNYVDGSSNFDRFNLDEYGQFKFTSLADKTIEKITVSYNSSTTNYVKHIQLEKGTEATEWEPYKEYNSSTTVDSSTGHTLYAKWTKSS